MKTLTTTIIVIGLLLVAAITSHTNAKNYDNDPGNATGTKHYDTFAPSLGTNLNSPQAGPVHTYHYEVTFRGKQYKLSTLMKTHIKPSRNDAR